MKALLFAAVLAIGGTAIAQTSSQSSTDGRDVHGHNPEGQPYSPPGYNNGIGGYPPASAAPAALIGGDYPPCSAQRTDRCVQTYVRGTRRSRR